MIWLGEVQTFKENLSHALNISDIFVAADQQSVIRRISQSAHSITQVLIDQVQFVVEETFLSITAALLNNISRKHTPCHFL